MPTTQSAEKRLRQSEKREERNKSVRSRIRTKSNRLRAADSVEEAEELLQELYAELDRAAGKNVMHPNKAARKKSQLAKVVDELREDS